MNIRPIDTKHLPSVTEGVSLFASREWAEMYPYGLQAYAIADKGGQPLGSFMLFHKAKWGLSYAITAPYAPHIGLTYALRAEKQVGRQSQAKEIHRAIAGWLKGASDILQEVALSTEEKDSQPYTWEGFDVVPRHTYLLDVSASEEVLLAGMSPERRKNIRKAEKDGLKVEQTADTGRFMQLIEKTIARQGLRLDMEVFQRLISDKGLAYNRGLYICSKEGLDMAASLLVWDQGRCYYLIGGYDESLAHEGAGAMNLWRAICDAKGRGNRIFDFEGSMIPEVERYFRGFGGDLRTYFSLARYQRLGRLMKRIKAR